MKPFYETDAFETGMCTIEIGFSGIFPAFLSGNLKKLVFSFLAILEGECMCVDSFWSAMKPYDISREIRVHGQSLKHIQHHSSYSLAEDIKLWKRK